MNQWVFLLLPQIPQSLQYRPHLERFGNSIVLGWCLERLRSRQSRFQPVVIVASEYEKDLICRSGVLVRHPGCVFVSPRTGKTRSLLAAALEFNTSTVIACGLEIALAPAGIVDLAVGHHERHANSYTLILGLPNGVAPELFRCELLHHLVQLNALPLPDDPVLALNQLGLGSRRACVENPLSPKHVPFDVGPLYKIQPGELPGRVKLRSPADIETARKVVSLTEGAENGLTELRAWRPVSVQQQKDERRRPPRIGLPFPAGSPDRSTPTILFVSNQSVFSGAEESLWPDGKFY